MSQLTDESVINSSTLAESLKALQISKQMTPVECLQKIFGYSSFRHQQQEIIDAILAQLDVCAVMATGHGKSICYQIPALVSRRPALVVSPLLSLMEDQRINLAKNGIAACCYNSTVHDKDELRNDILSGKYMIIYITPESVCSDGVKCFIQMLNQKIGISLVAIDESHCISLWGNSFRTSYLQLSCLKDWLPQVPTLALTGTATLQVEADIIKLLKMKNPVKIRTGSDRPNLSYFVHQKKNQLTDIKPLIENNVSIVYCQTRKSTETIAELLAKNGIQCQAYHAGLSQELKEQIHVDFLNSKLKCIVATIAFGMGIDKGDIRRIIHYGCPKDVESYTQEVGRAGRDGLPSQCHVFFFKVISPLTDTFSKTLQMTK